ncbi:MAG: alpha/beta hydrolase [Methanomassiliicoccaceae archaeon]|nr:alpha/beta hydrolase [Methanomassiliicoccaceae archaeon]
MPYANVNGISLYYDMEGCGPPLILITGFGGDVGFWRRASEMLSKRFTLIKIDNRGAGNTLYNGRFTLDNIADDIVRLVDELGLGRVSLLGWSMGSHIAQKAALLMPERVTALVLVSSYRYRPSRFNYIVTSMIDAAEGGMPTEYFAKVLNCICYTEEFFKGREGAGKGVRSYGFRDLTGLRYQIEAMGASDMTDLARGIRVPTLLIHGSRDATVECEEGLRLSGSIPGCDAVVLEGAGHLIPADEYVPLAMGFIERCLARERGAE